jgi:hypothetical protein
VPNNAHVPRTGKGRLGVILAMVLVVLLIAVGAVVSANALGLLNLSPPASAGHIDTDTTDPKGSKLKGDDVEEVEISDELAGTLNASYVTTQAICRDIVGKNGGTVIDGAYTLFLNALLESPPKLWSDALSTPLAGTTAEERYAMLKRAICEEPVIGGAFAHLLANLDLVYENQKSNWLKPWRVDDSEINDLVSQFLPLLTVSDPTDKQLLADYRANLKYQVFASKLVYILSRYTLAGTFNIQSEVNYHLVDGGLSGMAIPGEMVIPEIEVNDKQENLPALTFYLTEKDVCVPLSVLAFNLGDKRPELGVIPPDCESLTPPPPRPDCVSDCGWTPPDCPPEMPYGQYPLCKDSPDNDPEAQDNNLPGGGGLAPPVTDDAGPPAVPKPGPVYTPAPTPTPTATPDPAPAPSPEATQPPAAECAPAPGKPCP